MLSHRGLERFICFLSNDICQSKRCYYSVRVSNHYFHQFSEVKYKNLLTPRNRLSRNIHNNYSSASRILTQKMNKFKISDYNCVGFDLDNTLLRYNIPNMMTLEYNVLAKFLVDKKGYSANFLYRDVDLDFMQKGLILDFAHGNILRMGRGATIIRATHGTKLMSNEEIISTYGAERKWEPTSIFHSDFLVAWNGPLAEKFRTLLGIIYII